MATKNNLVILTLEKGQNNQPIASLHDHGRSIHGRKNNLQPFSNPKPNPFLISSPFLQFFDGNSNFLALILEMTRNLDLDSAPTFIDHHHPVLKLLDLTCRLLSVPLSLATIWLTVTNREDNSTYGRLEFNNLTGLKYMVSVSAISAAYALGMAVSSWIRCFVIKAWVFFVSDQIMAYLMITSAAAAAEILYLAHNGDREVSWSEACSSYAMFCHRMKLALILHGLAFLCFFLLSLISAYTTFSMFDPPLPSKEVQEERT